MLPRVRTWQACRRIRTRLPLWRRPLSLVLERHRLPEGIIRGVRLGTSPVFRVGTGRREVVVKFFPPAGTRDWRRERTALRAVARHGSPPVPCILADGILRDRSAWRYLVLRPVPGTAVRWVHRRLTRRDWLVISHETGVMARSLHAIRAPRDLPGLPAARYIGRSLRAFASTGAFPQTLVAEVRRRLPRLVAPVRGDPRALIHCDLNGTHVAVRRVGGRWRVTGIFDFGMAAAGDPLYECLPLWHGRGGNPEFVHAFLKAWRPNLDMTTAWRERAAAFILLHSDGPGPLLAACRRRQVDPSGLTWNRLVDLLMPL